MKTPKLFFMNLIEKFIDAIYKNKDMQSIMVWEMYENSSLTQKSARKREVTPLRNFYRVSPNKLIMRKFHQELYLPY